MPDNPLIIALVHDTDDAKYGHITYDGDVTYAKVVTGDLTVKKLDSGVEWRFGADFAPPADARPLLSALVRFTLITPPSAAYPIVLTLLDCGVEGVDFASSTAAEVYAAIVGGDALEIGKIESIDDAGVVTKAITGDALALIAVRSTGGGTVMLGGYQADADGASVCVISRDAGMTLELTFQEAHVRSQSPAQAGEAAGAVEHAAAVRSQSPAQAGEAAGAVEHAAAVRSQSPAQAGEAAGAVEHAAAVRSQSPAQAGEAAGAVEHAAAVRSQSPAQAGEAAGAVEHAAAVRSQSPAQAGEAAALVHRKGGGRHAETWGSVALAGGVYSKDAEGDGLVARDDAGVNLSVVALDFAVPATGQLVTMDLGVRVHWEDGLAYMLQVNTCAVGFAAGGAHEIWDAVLAGTALATQFLEFCLEHPGEWLIIPLCVPAAVWAAAQAAGAITLGVMAIEHIGQEYDQAASILRASEPVLLIVTNPGFAGGGGRPSSGRPDGRRD